MDSSPTSVVIVDGFPMFRIYQDGRIEKYHKCSFIPASDNPHTTVRSKDVIISPEKNVSARLFLPQTAETNEKLPVLVYIHGGGFIIESAFSFPYHSYVSSVVDEAKVLAISIEYRLAPEHPVPACYEDCWAVIKWLVSHVHQGPEPWINDHADLSRVFVAGDSAGGNIAHNMVARATVESVNIVGMILTHPLFGNGQSEILWESTCSDSEGSNDSRINPMAHPKLLSSLRCNKVLIAIAEKDFLRERGQLYFEALKKSGWGGQIEFLESEGEEHCFHLLKTDCDNSKIFLKRVASFLND